MTTPREGKVEDDGGPAFPCPRVTGQFRDPGMSLRDWFAGHALAGWLASFPSDEHHPAQDQSTHSCETVAKFSYIMADAMLAHRSGEDSP